MVGPVEEDISPENELLRGNLREQSKSRKETGGYSK